MSDAWFLGESNYLRAWAYCYDLSTRLERYEPIRVEWAGSVPEYGDAEESATQVTKRRKVSGSGRASTFCSSLIPSVPFSSISLELEHPLGYGRNGCVFRALWEGKHVAVKQFDLGVPGVIERAQKEISGYEKLKDCQGILVPNALFLTKSKFGIFFLGQQLGRMPVPDDDVSHWGGVLSRLHREYGFKHGDADGRNGLFIQDEEGNEHLVAIDLEEHEFVPMN